MKQTTKEKIKKTISLFIDPMIYIYIIISAVLLIGYDDNSIQWKVGLLMTVGVGLFILIIFLGILALGTIIQFMFFIGKLLKQTKDIWKA
jgi:hypothetical protein